MPYTALFHGGPVYHTGLLGNMKFSLISLIRVLNYTSRYLHNSCRRIVVVARPDKGSQVEGSDCSCSSRHDVLNGSTCSHCVRLILTLLTSGDIKVHL